MLFSCWIALTFLKEYLLNYKIFALIDFSIRSWPIFSRCLSIAKFRATTLHWD